MKKTGVLVAAMAMACAVLAQNLSLSDARAKIGAAIADPAVMASTVQKLAAADQVAFLAEVNAAIAKMPGSADSRAAAFLDANRAALKSAAKGNLTTLLAEMFATVPLDALTVLNENLAVDLFNRAANPSVTYTDEQFTKLARSTVADIAKRLAEVDDGAVRTGFAILMFTRASNGSPAGLADTLASELPEAYREVARKEWFPAALAAGDAKTYDPMLGDGDYGALPNEKVVLRLARTQSLEALLFELSAAQNASSPLSVLRTDPYGADVGGIGSSLDNGLYRVPFTYNKRVFGTAAGQKGSDRPIGGGSKVPGVPGGVPIDEEGDPVGPDGRKIEPGGYPGQD